jgi:ABC-type transporter lipoprotein component MlaA
VNRVFAWLDLEITRYLFSPVAMLYRGIVVRPVREHLANAGENILFPTRFCGNLLQAKWKDTGTETLRFVVNSTIGVLGLFDPAARMGLMPSDEDFGQVFARWAGRTARMSSGRSSDRARCATRSGTCPTTTPTRYGSIRGPTSRDAPTSRAT